MTADTRSELVARVSLHRAMGVGDWIAAGVWPAAANRCGTKFLMSNRSPTRWPKLVGRFHLPSAVCPPSEIAWRLSVWRQLPFQKASADRRGGLNCRVQNLVSQTSTARGQTGRELVRTLLDRPGSCRAAAVRHKGRPLTLARSAGPGAFRSTCPPRPIQLHRPRAVLR